MTISIGALLGDLRSQKAIAARAVELLVLTVARPGDVLDSKVSEFDLKTAVWTVPSDRAKAGRAHHIPLSVRAVEIVRELSMNTEGFLFPGSDGQPLSKPAMQAFLKRMKCDHVSVHDFRSKFRDWAAKHTSYPLEVRESALAHESSNMAGAIYDHDDLEKRRNLMAEWAKYCEHDGGHGNAQMN